MIKVIFSSSKVLSSKRIFGGLCIFLYICLLIGSFIGLQISITQQSLMDNLLYVGGGLLGVGVLEKYDSKINDNPNNMSENK